MKGLGLAHNMSRRKGIVLISALSDADRYKAVKKEEAPVVSTEVAILDDWYCHCCRARNKGNSTPYLTHYYSLYSIINAYVMTQAI